MLTNYEQNKQTELKVKQALEALGFTIHINPDKYGVYDMAGKDPDGAKVLVEVKSRTKKYAKMWIELDKVVSNLKIRRKEYERSGDTACSLLVQVIDDEMLAYNLRDLYNNCPRRLHKMNKTTSFKSQVKTTKEVIEYNYSDYMFDLTTGEVNSFRYEHTI